MEGIDLYGLFEPARIIDRLQLRLPSYLRTAAFAHFGRDDFSWEQPLVPAQGLQGHVSALTALEQIRGLGHASGLALARLKAEQPDAYARAQLTANHLSPEVSEANHG